MSFALVVSSTPLTPALAEELGVEGEVPLESVAISDEEAATEVVDDEHMAAVSSAESDGYEEVDDAESSVSISAKVVWAELEEQDIQDYKVELRLFADGTDTGKSVVLDGIKDEGEEGCRESDAWVATFGNLLEHDSAYTTEEGKPTEYTIKEDQTILESDGLSVEYFMIDENGNEIAVEDGAPDGGIIRYAHIPKGDSLEGDQDQSKGVRPDTDLNGMENSVIEDGGDSVVNSQSEATDVDSAALAQTDNLQNDSSAVESDEEINVAEDGGGSKKPLLLAQAGWCSTLTNNYARAKQMAGRQSFNGLCPAAVFYQLRAYGILTSGAGFGANGHDVVPKYFSGMRVTSGGYNVIYTAGSRGAGWGPCDAATNSGNTNGLYVISYTSTTAPAYGHVSFFVIENGTVYLAESYRYGGNPEGTGMSFSYANFKSSWGKTYRNVTGVVRLVKDNPPAIAKTPSIIPHDVLGGKKIELRDNQGGASIRYSTDGKSNPSNTAGAAYNGNWIVNTSATMSIRAIAYKGGMNNSSIASLVINTSRTGKPALDKTDLPSGATITLDAPGNGEVIFYTTDGSEPSFNVGAGQGTGTKYTSAFTLTKNATVKAIAVRSGELVSDKLTQDVEVTPPAIPTGLGTLIGTTPSSKLAVDDAITVKWDEDKACASYVATLYDDKGAVVESSTVKAAQAVFTPAKAGKYYIGVKAVNSVGASQESERVEFEAMAPCIVKFVDKGTDDNGDEITTVLDKQLVRYGYNAERPAVPTKRGYTFAGWDKDTPLTNITKDGYEIIADWQINTYTVRFLKSDGKSVIKTESVDFGSAATPPAPPEPEAGYVFTGWSVIEADDDSERDYSKVDSHMKLKAVYAWADQELPVVVSVTNAKRNERVYTVDVNVKNNPISATTAWLRVSLKTATGKLVQSTKETISLPAAGAETNHRVTLKYEEGGYIATKAEVEVVGYAGDNRTGGAYSKAVTADVVSADDYELATSASEWSTTKPADSEDYVIESEVQYRYRDKQTTTSTSSTLDGWTREGSPVTTYGSWSGEKSTTSKPNAGDTLTITGQSTQYNYYHWHSQYDGVKNHDSCWVNNTSVKHTMSLSSPMPNGPTYYFPDKGGKANSEYQYGTCPWSSKAYWWHESTITTYRYKTRSKTTTYSYYKWNVWSDWSNEQSAATDTREVEERTVYRTRAKMYNAVAGTEDGSGKTYTISGKFESTMQVAGKEATIMVYNVTNSDPNEDQIQYIGQTTIGADNSYSFSFIPKKEPSADTGDFIVSLGVKGSTGLVNVDKIEAPANEHKVVYLYKDASGQDVKVSEQIVEDGASAEVPDPPMEEGVRFQRWSASTNCVTNDMTITALYSTASYAVAWVDWVNGGVFLETKAHGDELVAPVENPTAKGYTFKGWDALLDGKTTVTGNTVINAVYEPEMYTVMFADAKGGVFSVQQVAYDQAATLPAGGPTAEGLEFVAWDTTAGTPWWNVTEDMIVKPLFAYEGTVSSPYSTAEIASGYVSAKGTKVYLTNTTENSRIYYTTDGSEPMAVDTESQNASSAQSVNRVTAKLSSKDADSDDIEPIINTSKLYDPSSGITVTEPTTIRAIAVADGMNDSSVTEIAVDVTATNDVSNATICVYDAPYYYGKPSEAEICVWMGDELLAQGDDYTIDYSDNDKTGIGLAVISGKGEYVGTQAIEFEILEPTAEEEQQRISIADANVSDISPATYTGKAIQPNPTVKLNNVMLQEGTDYEIAYKNNTSVGTATVLIIGKGNYTGSISIAFAIKKAASKISLAAQTQTYTSNAIAYTGTVTKSGSTGKVTYAYYSDADCTKAVSAADVKAAGNYYVRATLAADESHEGATSAAAKLTITKAKNPVVAKAVAKKNTVKYSKLKGKNQTITAKKAFKVTKAQGKVTYKKASGNKKITVSKAGKVTVKKGLKKGTYKVKVNVTAAGNRNYRKAAKTVTIKVVVS